MLEIMLGKKIGGFSDFIEYKSVKSVILAWISLRKNITVSESLNRGTGFKN